MEDQREVQVRPTKKVMFLVLHFYLMMVNIPNGGVQKTKQKIIPISRFGIHEPAVLSLTVSDLSFALYIEKEAGSQQLEAFVCEDAGEATELMQELR